MPGAGRPASSVATYKHGGCRVRGATQLGRKECGEGAAGDRTSRGRLSGLQEVEATARAQQTEWESSVDYRS